MNPSGGCAKLIPATEDFDKHFKDGDIEISGDCTREDLMDIAARATIVMSKAKAKGWTTLDQYLSY
ncbi:hypothetical protein D9M71_783400 [compost metagenome]